MAGIITGATIGAVGSIAGAGVSAAGAQASAAQQEKVAREQMNYLRDMYNKSASNLNPYLRTGRQATKAYREQMRGLADPEQYAQYQTDLSQIRTPYGMEQYQQSPLYTPMVRNLAELQATPGYQFELEQGLQQLGQGAAARGGLLSGAQQKAAMKYGQGVASTGFQNAWERAQKAYGNAFEQNLRQQAQYGQSQLAQNQQNYQQRLQSRGQAADIYGNAASLGAQSAANLGNIGTATGQAMAAPYKSLTEARGFGAAAPYAAVGGLLSNAGSIYGAGQDIYNASQNTGSRSGSTSNSQLPWSMRGNNWEYV
jgi:hypothetical protein